MLTALGVQNSRGDMLSIPLHDVSDGFAIRSIEGLGPVKATLVSSSYARLDGEQYQSSRREARNVIITIDLVPDHSLNSKTVSELRTQLYNFFMTESNVTMEFSLTDKPTLTLEGTVESAEPDIFTADPAVVISVMCFNPDFYNSSIVTESGMTTSGITETEFDYDGTVETGVLFTLNVDRALDEFAIYQTPPDGSLRSFEFAYPLEAGDVLTVKTTPGDKYVRLLRSGVLSSALFGMSPYSNWLELQPGINNIRVYAVGADIPYEIEYVEKYGGL
jgi:hypothetical protein